MPSFAELSAEFLDAEFADSPVRASGLGLTEYDDQLDDLSEAAFERRRRADATWLERFGAVDPSTLGFDEAIDRDLVVSILRGRQIVDDFEVWRRQPDTYLNPGMTGIFALFLHRLRPLEELVDAAVERMRLIPANLADGRRNLRPDMVPEIFLDRAANQARAGARYVREILPSQVDDAALAREAGGGRRGGGIGLRGIRRVPRGDATVGHRRLHAGRGTLLRAPAREGAARLRRSRAARPRPGGLRRAGRRADPLRPRAARDR